jgi:geranylgeranyl diphosphate synthase type I
MREAYRDLLEEAAKLARVIDHYVLDNTGIYPQRLAEASLHLFKAGGKRIRPTITLLAARMLGGVEAEMRAVPLASAVEVAHTFTLIHDDIMDKDEFRRGVPTTHVVFGEDWALLAGDLLHALSFKFIADGVSRGLSYEQVYRALKALSDAAIQVSRGQALDMLYEKTWEVTVTDYLNMVRLKTGALIEAAARIGAIAAGSPQEIEDALGLYGCFTGIAFQIKDDILGVYGDPKVTGKPVFNDLRRGKKTILVIYAVVEAGREEVKRLIGPGASEEDLRRAAKIIEESGALDYALKTARRYSERAREVLEEVGAVDERAKKLLLDLAVYVVEREK